MATGVREATFLAQDATSFTLAAGELRMRVSAVDSHVVRVRLSAAAELDEPPSPAVLRPLSSCSAAVTRSEGAVQLSTGALSVNASLSPSLCLSWSDGKNSVFAQDRLHRAYALGSASALHACRRASDDSFFGLGDKAGPLNLAGRRVRTHMCDALGRDPASGDPGYKHWPFLVVRTRGASAFSGCSPTDATAVEDTHTCYGVFYDTPSVCSFDLGCEHSNYHGLLRSCESASASLDYYLILGPDFSSVTKRFLRLTGRAPMVPRWSLGYGMTAMPLADAADAQSRIAAFASRAREEGYPASSFHFGSGYTLIKGKRCVFTWSAEKFPQPAALLTHLHGLGLHTVANVKPCLLREHPAFASVVAAGLCIRESPAPEAGPAMAQFWDGEGAHVDFSNPAAVEWWRKGLREALFAVGMDAAWNDNNECEGLEDAGTSAFGGAVFERVRGLQPLLMSAASIAETAAAHPSLRPFGISRACSPGCQRYVTTWSGDNTTSWASLAWGQRCGLQMAVSGLYLTGQDVGGFAGPPPDPELLVRWYQAGALWPRFVSNSWKACGTVTSPWLHPGAPAEACRAALQLRYRLMPYLYTLCRAASDDRNEPPVRPLFWDWGAADESVWSENSELMLGRQLLAAPVLAPGERTRTLRLPLGPLAWFDARGGEVLAPGSTVSVQAPLESMPLFCPAGAMLPLATDETHQGLPHDAPGRRLLVFPAPAAAGEHVFESELFEDDGECADGGPSATLRFRLSCGAEAPRLSVELEDGGYALPFKQVLVMLPPGEARQLSLTSGPGAPQLLQADWQPLF